MLNRDWALESWSVAFQDSLAGTRIRSRGVWTHTGTLIWNTGFPNGCLTHCATIPNATFFFLYHFHSISSGLLLGMGFCVILSWLGHVFSANEWQYRLFPKCPTVQIRGVGKGAGSRHNQMWCGLSSREISYLHGRILISGLCLGFILCIHSSWGKMAPLTNKVSRLHLIFSVLPHYLRESEQ